MNVGNRVRLKRSGSAVEVNQRGHRIGLILCNEGQTGKVVWMEGPRGFSDSKYARVKLDDSETRIIVNRENLELVYEKTGR